MVEQQTEKCSPATKLASNFIKSQRQGLASHSIQFYECYLNRASHVIGFDIVGQDIAQFLDNLGCGNSEKHAYYRTLRVSYNWLYSRKSGYNLDSQGNPVLAVEAPKVEKRILPSLTPEQLDYLINGSNATCNGWTIHRNVWSGHNTSKSDLAQYSGLFSSKDN